jgi:hypothetical protein
MSPPFSSPIEAILAVEAALIVLGAILFFRGLRPKRKGDDPHCRRCDYSLVGLETDRCPECGSILSPAAIIRGQRHRRPRLIWCGAIALLLGLATMIPLASPRVRNPPWYHYKPTFMVMRDLRSGSAIAIQELYRRERAGQLSPAVEQQIDEIALAAQATTATDLTTRGLIDFLGGQYLAGHLTDEQKRRFAQQCFGLTLHVPPVVLLGAKTVYTIDESSRVNGPGFLVEFSWSDPKIGGDQLPPEERNLGAAPSVSRLDATEHSSETEGLGSFSNKSDFRSDQIGRQHFELMIHIELRQGTFAASKIVYEEDRKLTANFDVIPKVSPTSTQPSSMPIRPTGE